MSTHAKIIKHKVGRLHLAEELGNVSQACKVMGYSRDTFYRYQQAVEEGGVEALVEKSRRKPNIRNRVAPEIEDVGDQNNETVDQKSCTGSGTGFALYKQSL